MDLNAVHRRPGPRNVTMVKTAKHCSEALSKLSIERIPRNEIQNVEIFLALAQEEQMTCDMNWLEA